MFDCLLCLANIYMEAGVGYVDPMTPPPHERFKYEANHYANPMGRAAIGYELDSKRLTLSLEIRHESWIGTSKDHGQNSVWISSRVRPFK